jgi:hypothetical protein
MMLSGLLKMAAFQTPKRAGGADLSWLRAGNAWNSLESFLPFG